MAGLLDYVNKAGGWLDERMQRLVTPDVAVDPAMEEMMSPEQRLAARRQARSAGIAAMNRAAQEGAHWTALGAARNVAGQGAYGSYVTSAVQSAEELRRRREAEGRRQRTAELVARLSNPGDPLASEYTQEQIAVLGALSPDDQAALLAKTAFPKQSGLSVATAGTIQQVRKLANGNIGIIVQTGDPEAPYKIHDTGQPFVSEDPSAIRTLQEIIANPGLINAASDLKKGEASGTKTGEANVAALVALPQAINAGRSALASMETFKQELASTPTGALTGRVLQLFNSDFQKLEADAYSEALREIGRLKAEGVSLNPITENELALLLATSPRLTNRPEANVRIIDARMARGRRALAQLEEQLAWLDAGYDITQYRPGSAPPPRQPAQGVPPPAPRVSSPPAGGAGAVSTIPTIRRPGQ